MNPRRRRISRLRRKRQSLLRRGVWSKIIFRIGGVDYDMTGAGAFEHCSPETKDSIVSSVILRGGVRYDFDLPPATGGGAEKDYR